MFVNKSLTMVMKASKPFDEIFSGDIVFVIPFLILCLLKRV